MAIIDYIPGMRRKDDKSSSTEASHTVPVTTNSADSDVVMEQGEDGRKDSSVERCIKRRTRTLSVTRDTSSEDTVMMDPDLQQSSPPDALQKDYDVLQKKYDDECFKTRRLQNTVDENEEEVKWFKKRIDSDKKQTQSLKKRLDEATSDLQRQSDQVKNLTRALKTNKQELRDVKSQHDHLNTQYYTLLHTTDTESARLKAQIHSQTAQTEHLQKDYKANLELLEVRTRELSGAHEYLHATRTCSGAELGRLVESLNGEMMQAAAIITESLELEQAAAAGSPRDRSKLDDAARESLRLFMSDDMMALFYALDPDDSETLIQSALQAAMAYCCTIVINNWSMDETVNDLVRDIYRRQGISSASGRWRAITKSHTKYASIDDFEESMRARMYRLMISVLAMAGWVAEDNEHEAKVRVCKIMDERISLVMKLALQIDKVVGLKMTSEDWEVFVVTAGDAFDVDSMQDAYGIHKVKSVGGEIQALCTTDLGLRSRQVGDGVGEVWQATLKPKVLLNTAF